MDAERVIAGRELRAAVQGAKSHLFTEGMRQIDPRLPEWSDGWIFGEAWAGSTGLTLDDQVLVAIIALAVTNKPDQLRIYLHGALQRGMDASRIHESLLLLPIYVGFPTALQSLGIWRDVVLSARRRGLDVEVPVT